MTFEIFRAILGWSAILNLILLSLWFFIFLFMHDALYRMHGRWFHFSRETFDAIHYTGMAFYKIATWMFFIFPYLVMRLFL